MALPVTFTREISPPISGKLTSNQVKSQSEKALAESLKIANASGPAAIEAGEHETDDHLEYFSRHLESVLRPAPDGAMEPSAATARLSLEGYRRLYMAHSHEHGCHFVVHQHDHPISGVHYDLRLQFSATSTVSWAIPYGLPGNPNSRRLNRMAIETRVHNLWNNLVESASHATGSLLIWDTGHYEVLPRLLRPSRNAKVTTTDTESCSSDEEINRRVGNSRTFEAPATPQNERLIAAFQARYIRLRLHGTRLPPGYTIVLRLPSNNITELSRTQNEAGKGSLRRTRKRRRVARHTETPDETPSPTCSSSFESDAETTGQVAHSHSPQTATNDQPEDVPNPSSSSSSSPSNQIRLLNAYPGATNTINSIHQRRWIVSLDRQRTSHPTTTTTNSADAPSTSPNTFIVRGRDHERSIVTGRLARDVCADAGVCGFVGRRRWRAVVE